jgi:hypothetical protein
MSSMNSTATSRAFLSVPPDPRTQSVSGEPVNVSSRATQQYEWEESLICYVFTAEFRDAGKTCYVSVDHAWLDRSISNPTCRSWPVESQPHPLCLRDFSGDLRAECTVS